MYDLLAPSCYGWIRSLVVCVLIVAAVGDLVRKVDRLKSETTYVYEALDPVTRYHYQHAEPVNLLDPSGRVATYTYKTLDGLKQAKS